MDQDMELREVELVFSGIAVFGSNVAEELLQHVNATKRLIQVFQGLIITGFIFAHPHKVNHGPDKLHGFRVLHCQ